MPDDRETSSSKTRGIAPSFLITRLALAFVFFWHGLVPKLIVRHPLEAELLTLTGIEEGVAWTLVTVAGIGEMLWAAVLLVMMKARWPAVISAVALVGLLVGAIAVKPDLLEAPFNPLTLTVGLVALCVIDVKERSRPRGPVLGRPGENTP